MAKKIGEIVFMGLSLVLYLSTYRNGRRALFMEESGPGHIPFGILTVNLPDQPLKDGEFFVKNWSENREFAPWILENTELFEETGESVSTGFAEAPIWRFKKGAENA